MRNIGNMAENLLSMWCAEAGLTVNISQQDNMGWDHHIEFPLSNIISRDQVHQSAPKCKVQVKATDKADRKLQVTLSNLRAMAVDPLPYFFLFIEYDGKTMPQKAYLRLVDNDLIRQILKKIHAINVSDKENKFNKKTMIVKYDSHCEIEELSGQSFKTLLESYFDNNFDKTVTDKLNFIKTVGYEDSIIKLGFQITGEESIEKIVDVSLGLEGTISVEQLIATSSRFGIETAEPLLSSSIATLSMPNLTPTVEAKLIFQKEVFDTHYTFDVGIYFPVISDLNSPYFKTRFKGDFFDIYYFKNALQLVIDLSVGENIGLSISGSGGKPFIGNLITPSKFIDYQREMDTLDKAIRILKYYDYNDSVKLNYEELCSLEETITPFHDLLHTPDLNFVVTFSVDKGEIDTDAPLVAIGSIKFRIGVKLFLLLYSAEGKILKEKTENRYKLEDSKVNIEKRFVCNIKDVPSDEDIFTALKSIEASFKDKLIIILHK